MQEIRLSAKRSGKTEATRRAMQAVLDSGEHAHLARIGRTEGVNCPAACRAAGVVEWDGEG